MSSGTKNFVPDDFLPTQIPNLLGWYDATDESTLVEVSGRYSDWLDKSGNGNDLVQATGADQPIYDAATNSITFDGASQFLKAVGFTLNQPETIYFVGRQIGYTSPDVLYDGNTSTSGRLAQTGVSPALKISAGAQSAGNGDLAVGADGVVAVVFNGASSSLSVNDGTKTTGNYGAANMSGFTLGARGDDSNFSNIIVYEVAIYSAAHSAAEQSAVIAGLMNKHSI